MVEHGAAVADFAVRSIDDGDRDKRGSKDIFRFSFGPPPSSSVSSQSDGSINDKQRERGVKFEATFCTSIFFLSSDTMSGVVYENMCPPPFFARRLLPISR